MIEPSDLDNRAMLPAGLSERQQEVAQLVRQYVDAAHELPSAGWLSRRLNISRQRAYSHLRAFMERSATVR